jgi:hypothetical protein
MGDLRTELPVCEHSTARQLPSPDEVQAFVEQYIPAAVSEVFPDWQGFLIKSSDPKASVWIVRTREDGERLHRLTGNPGLLLTDVLAQRGRSLSEARKALLKQIIRAPRSGVGEGTCGERGECANVESAEEDGAVQVSTNVRTSSSARN